ncbi:MAG: DUF4402 domain-containing protein, partial [Lutibacter sp.]
IMKKITLLTAIVALSIAFSTTASAQVTASAPTTATIVAPIAITKNVDMKFGNVAVSSTAGTVLMTASATPTRTPSGGVTLPTTATGAPTAAKFTVTGEGVYTYAITLPSTALTLDEAGIGTATMTVNAFTSTPSTTGTLAAGTQDLYVGATLNVGASQVAGLYENTTGFAVTVNYN